MMYMIKSPKLSNIYYDLCFEHMRQKSRIYRAQRLHTLKNRKETVTYFTITHEGIDMRN